MEELKMETPTTTPQRKKSKKKLIIGIIVAIVVVIAAFIGITSYQAVQEQKAAEEHAQRLAEYEKDLSSFLTWGHGAGIAAEGVVSTYSKVWHDAIFDSYATINGERYYDFNKALQAQYTVFSTDGTLEGMGASMELVNGVMKELKNPPEEFELEYQTALEAYSSLTDFVTLAENPTGNLQTFNQESSEKDNQMASDLQKLDSMIGYTDSLSEDNTEY